MTTPITGSGYTNLPIQNLAGTTADFSFDTYESQIRDLVTTYSNNTLNQIITTYQNQLTVLYNRKNNIGIIETNFVGAHDIDNDIQGEINNVNAILSQIVNHTSTDPTLVKYFKGSTGDIEAFKTQLTPRPTSLLALQNAVHNYYTGYPAITGPDRAYSYIAFPGGPRNRSFPNNATYDIPTAPAIDAFVGSQIQATQAFSTSVLSTQWGGRWASNLTSTLEGIIAPLASTAGNFDMPHLFAHIATLSSTPKDTDAFFQVVKTFYSLNDQDTTTIKNAFLSYLVNYGYGTNTNDNTLLSDTGLSLEVGKDAFTAFLKTLNFSATGGQTEPSAVFNYKANEFFVRIATLSNESKLNDSATAEAALNFEDVFNAFFQDVPAGTDFKAELTAYIQQLSADPTNLKGFTPSGNLKDWLSEIEKKYQIALYGGPVGTSLIGESFKQVDIIMTVFQLLVKMVGTLQLMTASQADKLRVLAKWQVAYTSQQTLISSRPIVVDGQPGATTDNSAGKQSNDLQTIQAKRSIVSDDAKALQSSLNQSNDTTNQQANLLTAILQQLSTILSWFIVPRKSG